MSRKLSALRRERRRLYSSEYWKLLAAEVRKRDRYTCQRCGCRHKEIDKTVHHIVGFAYAILRLHKPNLILLCHHCHTFVHSKDNTNKEFIADDEHGITDAINRGKRRRNECA